MATDKSAFDRMQEKVPVWRRPHVHKVRYVESGPPRDIAGATDNRMVHNPYQRQMIQQIEHRDRKKFAMGHVEEVPDTRLPPEPTTPIPINQPVDYYVRKGFEAARSDQYSLAYHYYTIASRKAKSFRDQNRWNEAAISNLKEWRKTQ